MEMGGASIISHSDYISYEAYIDAYKKNTMKNGFARDIYKDYSIVTSNIRRMNNA